MVQRAFYPRETENRYKNQLSSMCPGIAVARNGWIPVFTTLPSLNQPFFYISAAWAVVALLTLDLYFCMAFELLFTCYVSVPLVWIPMQPLSAPSAIKRCVLLPLCGIVCLQIVVRSINLRCLRKRRNAVAPNVFATRIATYRTSSSALSSAPR
jgi:hypothetical protein